MCSRMWYRVVRESALRQTGVVTSSAPQSDHPQGRQMCSSILCRGLHPASHTIPRLVDRLFSPRGRKESSRPSPAGAVSKREAPILPHIIAYYAWQLTEFATFIPLVTSTIWGAHARVPQTPNLDPFDLHCSPNFACE